MLKQQITDAMKAAMKGGDKPRLATIRLIMAAIKQQEVDSRKELSDEDVITILTKMVKQRRDSVEQYTKAGRNDLADQETAEIAIIDEYLPEQLSEEEIKAIVSRIIKETGATTMKDMGRVMGMASKELAGKADNKTISGLVRHFLS